MRMTVDNVFIKHLDDAGIVMDWRILMETCVIHVSRTSVSFTACKKFAVRLREAGHDVTYKKLTEVYMASREDPEIRRCRELKKSPGNSMMGDELKAYVADVRQRTVYHHYVQIDGEWVRVVRPVKKRVYIRRDSNGKIVSSKPE